MATQFEIAESQLADLKQVCLLGGDSIANVADALDALRDTPLHPRQLLDAVAKSLDGDREAAESVCRQALAMNGIMRQAGLTLEDVSSGLGKAIDGLKESDSVFFEAWARSKEQVLRLVATKAARLTAKAIDLAYDYANLFRRGRILTDVRPLFSQDNNDIEGAVISYTLRLRYDNVAGDYDLSLAMDQRDVEQLLAECQKALKKGATAKRKMNSLDVAAFVTGEKADDAS